MKTNLVFILTLLVAAIALPTTASADDNWFGSVDLALHQYHNQTDPQFFGGMSSHGVAYRLTAGYNFNNYFSVDAGYVSLGQFEIQGLALLDQPIPEQRIIDDTLKPYGLVVDLTGTYPMSDRWSAFVRGGQFVSRVGNSAGPNMNGGRFTYGAGLNWVYSDPVTLRLTWDRYSDLPDGTPGGTFNVSILALGLVYSFQ
jgi:OmpA-OmpF porin, OOP family